MTEALKQAGQYEEVAQSSDSVEYNAAAWEVRPHTNIYQVNEEHVEYAATLKIPQFMIPMHLPLFGEHSTTLLTREALSEGFTLKNKDTVIDFSTIEGEIARVDIAEGSAAVPIAWKLTGTDNQFFREYFNSQPPEKRIAHCKSVILGQLSKINAANDREIEESSAG